MKNLTPRKIAAACGGRYHGPKELLDQEVTSVVIDSRKAEEGCLFVPIRGARVDGHDFIPDVMQAGALVTLSERTEGMPQVPYISVDSTKKALQEIAGFYRQSLGIPVVGITGSVGKTSTKEMIASVLERKYRVLKTAGNFNSNIGLPLTIFRMTPDDEMAVLEMGISHFGEMEELAETAAPDAMVITNIGDCHLEFLGDRRGVFRAKTECFDFIRPGGSVILNGEDALLREVKEVQGRRPVFYGRDPKNRVWADEIRPLGLQGTHCRIHVDEEEFEVTIPAPGGHMVLNALAAAAVGALFGLDMEEIRAGIEELPSLSGRLNIVSCGDLTVIDDCYNANPMSMKASLSVLSQAEGPTVAVLGDMGELGKDERALHREVGECAGSLALTRCIFVGELAKEMADAARREGGPEVVVFDTVDELLPALSELLPEEASVLVKASHFMGFDRIVGALKER